MNPPENTPFRHTGDYKTPDATPEWIPRGEGHFERICTCHTQVHYPPMWRRPDILDPSVMQHERWCEIADRPDLLKLAVKVNKESSYDFAHLRSLLTQLVRLGSAAGRGEPMTAFSVPAAGGLDISTGQPARGRYRTADYIKRRRSP